MSWLSNFLKGGSPERDTTYQGASPRYSLTDVAGYKEAYPELIKRLSGQGVGYGAGYEDIYSNPIVNKMRGQFQNYQLPELQSELSKTGRRKGTAGFDQIRRAYQEQGLNEGDVYSRLAQANEAQKRNEINSALQGLMQFGGAETAQHNTATGFDYGKYQNEVNLANASKKAQSDQMGKIIAGIAQMGLSMGGASGASGASAAMSSPQLQGSLQGYGGTPLNFLERYNKPLTNQYKLGGYYQ